MNRSQLIALGTAAGAAALIPQPLQAAGPGEVRVSFSTGASAWPMYAGIDNGIFAAAGLTLTVLAPSNSAEVFAQLDRGACDIAHTALDDAVALDVAPGDVPANHDFSAFFGVDDGMWRVVAKPGISTVAALRGKTVATDALGTGDAFVLRAMLEKAGLGVTDVTWVAEGGTAQRYAGLVAGTFDATLLTPPYDVQANEQQCVTVAKAIAALGAYQGISGVARRAWLTANHDTAVTYLHAYRTALGQLVRDRAAAISLFRRHGDALSPNAAAQSYDAAFAKTSGFRRNAALDMKGVRAVLDLRAKYATVSPGTDPGPYTDTKILSASG